ncbi:hypothetical protein OH738_38185 [Streptomyces hirsutus]|uniref:hypothetical protein n=1 Tax=Streptomyces hirsutus TaxID=35620 RepID=UPI0038658C01|nr:hypothetical protein OH738_38185 [Streptomyces hirsutus]
MRRRDRGGDLLVERVIPGTGRAPAAAGICRATHVRQAPPTATTVRHPAGEPLENIALPRKP